MAGNLDRNYLCRMFASLDLKNMNNSQKFDNDLQELAKFARVISHPARLRPACA